MKKRSLCMCLALILCFLLSACGGSGEEGTVNFEELKEKMIAADETMPKMESVDSESENAEHLFTNLSDLEYVKVEKYFFLYSSTGSAHELAVVKLRSEGDVEDAKETIEEYIENRTAIFKTYAPDEVEVVENTKILSYGSYVVMIMSPNAEAIEDVCREMLK